MYFFVFTYFLCIMIIILLDLTNNFNFLNIIYFYIIKLINRIFNIHVIIHLTILSSITYLNYFIIPYLLPYK